jgi:hypothetical protein
VRDHPNGSGGEARSTSQGTPGPAGTSGEEPVRCPARRSYPQAIAGGRQILNRYPTVMPPCGCTDSRRSRACRRSRPRSNRSRSGRYSVPVLTQLYLKWVDGDDLRRALEVLVGEDIPVASHFSVSRAFCKSGALAATGRAPRAGAGRAEGGAPTGNPKSDVRDVYQRTVSGHPGTAQGTAEGGRPRQEAQLSGRVRRTPTWHSGDRRPTGLTAGHRSVCVALAERASEQT